jgi:tetratricopeptide (TPR) repeat protein
LKYRAFLSYSHSNEKWARWIHRSLERYRVPKHIVESANLSRTRLKPIFLDREELASSTSLSDSIREALAESEALIVICSPGAAASKWVNQEVEEFRRLHGGENIFCCIVDGVAPAVFSPALLSEGEPLAADLTDRGDGKRAGFTKLVAGLLGVRFDDLRRREYQVRNRKLAAVTLASLLGMAVMTALGVSALIARDQAEQARHEAEQRREQAEDLLAFMVGDLRESLEPLGRLDLLDGVGDQAMDYFESVDANAINDGSLTLQSQVLTQIGEIRMSQFQYEEASRAFEQAYRYVEPLVQRHPRDGEKLFQRSQAEFWTGYMRWRTGDLEGARQWLQRYYESSLELTVLDPSREDWLQEVAWGHHNLGVLAVEQQELDRARELFGKELKVLLQLTARSPTVDETRENIADVYSWLGRISEEEGNLREALASYGESARYRQELLSADPDHFDRKQWYIVASVFTASIQAITGQVKQAAAAYATLIPLLAEMVESDPENRELQRYLARLRVDSAEFLIPAAEGLDRATALSAVNQAIDELEHLLRAEPEDRRARTALGKAYRVKATLHLIDDDDEAALGSALKAFESLEEDLSDVGLLREYGAALVVAFMVQAAVKDEPETASLNERQSDFERQARNSRDPRTLDALARIAKLKGDTDQARSIVQKLDQSGYVPIWPWF